MAASACGSVLHASSIRQPIGAALFLLLAMLLSSQYPVLHRMARTCSDSGTSSTCSSTCMHSGSHKILLSTLRQCLYQHLSNIGDRHDHNGRKAIYEIFRFLVMVKVYAPAHRLMRGEYVSFDSMQRGLIFTNGHF